ncbi:MAG TPA: peptide MFS transporter [Sphingomicrobium sp.]|nr:peptide MFS transporter [Sphingomicrobium sp.]
MSTARALATVEEAPSGSFFGHPKGLAYLAFTEAWERFSYYGMSALLVLYMVDQLLLPGHVGRVVGFAHFRHALESVFGPLSSQALASQIFGLYSGFVYFTPVLGGWIADRWIGQRSAVVLGALCMSGGHIAMAFDQSFLFALLLLVLGSGLLKGNISAQVGALYPPSDETRRTRGFAIFSTAINVGAVTGPLACGFLGERFGWHVGFGAAALFMLGGLATYLSGYRHLPVKVERKRLAAASMTRSDWKSVGALVSVMAIAAFQSIAYYQLANVLPVWLQQHGDMSAAGFLIPIPWYQSIDPLFSILFVPVLFTLWRWQDGHGGEPSELGKIGQGAWLCALANLTLVVSILAAGSHRVLWIWPFIYCALQGIGFVYYWPTLLALVSRAAPPKINGTMMGICFLTLFISNVLIGWIGTFYEQLGPLAFWTLHAGIAAAGGVLVLLFGPLLKRTLEPRNMQALRPSAMTQEVER